MKKIIALFMLVVLALCFCSCGENEISYETNNQIMEMEDELDQYHSFNEYYLLYDDEAADFYDAVAEKYGDDVAEDVLDLFYRSSHPLGDRID